MAWTSLCELQELSEGCGKYAEIGGFQLALFLHHEQVYVMDNYCPHAGGNMAGGIVHDGCAVCPWHDWAFHLESGQLRGSPGVSIMVYKTRLFRTSDDRTLVQADLPIY